jgi:2-polyprenyl-3-methyl-5-hydroxy-6-metoxy-1,4-benzoquinol methylase
METAVLESLEGVAGAEQEAAPCPVCAGRDFEVLLTPRDVGAERRWLRGFYRRRVTGGEESLKDRTEFTQDMATHIVRCLECGTLLRDPRPNASALRALYARDAYGDAALEALAENERALFEARVSEMRSRLPDGARLLEIGAFVGAFLRAAGAAGYRATGVDVGEETVAFMQRQGLDVRRGDVRDVDLPERAWDGVFIWNTFDQVADPHALLDRAGTLLKPGGCLVIRTPNGDFETGCRRLMENAGSRRAANLRRAQTYNNFITFPYLAGYTPRSLCRLLKGHGFTVESVRGDTLTRLAAEDTLPCAVREEARVKRAVARFCRHVGSAGDAMVWPWIETYADRDGD